MRLLFLADAIFEDMPGGSRTAARELARRLIQNGHEVTFLVGQKNANTLAEEVMPDGRHIIRYEGAGQGLSFVRGGYEACRKLWARQTYDIVHCQFAFASTGPLRAIPSHIPKVRTFHGPWDEESEVHHSGGRASLLSNLKLRAKSAFCRAIESDNLQACESVITLSDCFRDKVISRYGVAPSKVKVIPGGVDTERFAPAEDKTSARQMLGLPHDRKILLTVRRLAPRMGLDNLISSMPEIISNHPDVLLVLGGKGREQSRLEAIIAELGLTDHVQLKGFVAEQDLPRYYQAADLFVLPTVALEGFGLVTLEALASGLPVIGTPVGGTVEILSKLDSRLITNGVEPRDIANAVASFFDDAWAHGLTPSKLRQFVIDNYSWDKHVSEIEAVYDKMTPSFAKESIAACAPSA